VNLGRAALGVLLALAASPRASRAQGFGEFSLRGGLSIATPGYSVVGGTGPGRRDVLRRALRSRRDPARGWIPGVSSERHVWRYGGGARYEFGKAEWRPYLVGGLGGYQDKGRRREVVDGVEFVSDLSWFGVNVGAGVRHELGRSRFSLLAESRLHLRMQRVYPDYDLGQLELVTVMAGGCCPGR